MARNRKRAKERRARRPQGASVAASGRVDPDAAPAPIEHASPDVELAEAQLALGRPDLADVDADANQDSDAEYEPAPDEEELEAQALDAGAPPRRGGGGGDLVAVGDGPRGAVPEPRRHPGNRLLNFARGSWRELQRVQWPDRRQVMQATGVVIGFVIVAGAFLGVSDFLAGKVMNYILTGNFK
jgi:preprotein translocase subunit SecE